MDVLLDIFIPGLKPEVHTLQKNRVSIGCAETCDIVIPPDQTYVSQVHLTIECKDPKCYVLDGDGTIPSTNGYFLNAGWKRGTSRLRYGDVLIFGLSEQGFDRPPDQLQGMVYGVRIVFRQRNSAPTAKKFPGVHIEMLDVSHVVKIAGKDRHILDTVNLTIRRSEFVGVLGGSGHGKSTLVNAMSGFQPVSSGNVLINSIPLQEQSESFRQRVGFVPQDDILHRTLTVAQALTFTAAIRLPELTPQQRQKRIEDALKKVQLGDADSARKVINNLSGGQRKRISIAAELLHNPQLIFLDEPTSGLDPSLDQQLMRLLRQMADQQGTTIVLVTHNIENIGECHMVTFVARGQLAYFGPPQEACAYFFGDAQLGNFADIYDRIDASPEYWTNKFKGDTSHDYFRDYIVQRQQHRPKPDTSLQSDSQKPQSWQQFLTLAQRSFALFRRDSFTFAFLFLTMPIIGILLKSLSEWHTFVGLTATGSESYTPWTQAQRGLFVMALSTVLLGLFATSDELVKERSIFQRERMVNLAIWPYLLSKVLLFGGLAVMQVLLLMTVLQLPFPLFSMAFPDGGLILGTTADIFVTLWLSSVASVCTGLLVSSLANDSNVVPYIMIVLIFVQILFSGAIFDLGDTPLSFISYLTITRWSLDGLGAIINMENLGQLTRICIEDTCQNTTVTLEDMPLNYDSTAGYLGYVWGILSLFSVVPLFLTYVMTRITAPVTGSAGIFALVEAFNRWRNR